MAESPEIIRNVHDLPAMDGPIHGGIGAARNAPVFGPGDFSTALRFVNYTELPAGASIGAHMHGDDEELYCILDGTGRMTINGESHEVKSGDMVLNRPFWTHELANTGGGVLRLIVFGAANKSGEP
jgi:mannose-6-phosphate isomerase-like protein (cupin superfamily)